MFRLSQASLKKLESGVCVFYNQCINYTRKKHYMLEIIKREVTYYFTSETKSFTPVESFCIYHI